MSIARERLQDKPQRGAMANSKRLLCAPHRRETQSVSAGFCLSVRPWHAQPVLSDVGQHQIVSDRRCLVEPRLAEFTLDVVLGGKAVAAMTIETGIGRFPGRLGTQVFGCSPFVVWCKFGAILLRMRRHQCPL